MNLYVRYEMQPLDDLNEVTIFFRISAATFQLDQFAFLAATIEIAISFSNTFHVASSHDY
jgi:hypothetical protein